MALKDLFDKGKCLVGLHQGDWTFDAADRCSKTRLCTICGAASTRVEHHWSEWTYESINNCELTRACERCRDLERRTEHAWNGWQYAREGECMQLQLCGRCGASGGQTQVAHMWEPWAYSEPHCAPIRRCGRCGVWVSKFARQSIDYVQPAASGDAALGAEITAPPRSETASSGSASKPDSPTDFDLFHLFSHGDTAALADFVAQCPDSIVKASVLDFINQGDREVQLLGLCMLADPYCRGKDAALGTTICTFVHAVSQRNYDETGSPNYLTIVAQSAITSLVGYASQGEHEHVIRFGKAAADWLEARRSDEQKAELLMHRIEAHLELQQFDAAGALLDIAETVVIPPGLPAQLGRRQQLRRRFDLAARQRATQLLPVQLSASDKFAADRKELSEMVGRLQAVASVGVWKEHAGLQALIAEAAALAEGDAGESHFEWLERSEPVRARLTEFLTGGAGGTNNALRNRQRKTAAVAIFRDPIKGRDSACIEGSLATLLEVRSWAEVNDFPDDENDALWGLYLCYVRTQRPEQAIEMLQALRSNLERRRSRIVDPEQRAGAFRVFPRLFGELCHLLCRDGREAELLGAIEGAKGRFLADVLTRQRGEAVPDSESGEPTEALLRVLQAGKAHYLSYFVDDEEIYAVLVARDGSMHCQAIGLGRERLRVLVQSVDPKTWNGTRTGLFPSPAATCPLDELASLVQWLEPHIEAGTLRQGDHICYCPDEQLHLVPLHYLRLRGKPLVQSFSMSRIHSAAALTTLLEKPCAIPSRFVALQVPAQQDLNDPQKLSSLARVPAWLAERSSGVTLAREHGTVDALADLDLSGRLIHFATHGTFPSRDASERNPNPFQASGLALAQDGELPSLALVSTGKSDDTLLTPERVLDLRFDGSHVTLQACVSGLAKEGIGGDALGLDLAFLLSGAQSLLATHWNIPANASADFSVRFYQRWSVEKSSRAESWREAVLHLMHGDGPSTARGEYYWAGFSLSGDWR